MGMLTDNPIVSEKKDDFGFSVYANIIADTIIDTDNLPYCVGIFAEWGSGKSSLMNMIREKLNLKTKIKTIWFNPWKYDKKEDLWNALIQTVLFGIAEESKDEDVTKNAKDLAKSTAWILLKKGVAAVSSGVISEENIEKIAQKIVDQDEKYYKHINQFEESFSSVVDQFTGNGKLVVFIDDLDRCLPENAITVLESLKLFMGDSRCVFVLGMDYVVVEQGLSIKFSKNVKISSREYLDKIIQVPFFLPPVQFDKLKKSLEIDSTVNFNKQIWELVRYGLGGNPRKTKRFVNSLHLVNKIIESRSVDAVSSDEFTEYIGVKKNHQLFYVAKLLVFQLVFLEFYMTLKEYPDSWNFYENKLINAETIEDRERMFAEIPAIKRYWEDYNFRNFMEKTHGSGFPGPPKHQEIIPLMQAISLVSNQ